MASRRSSRRSNEFIEVFIGLVGGVGLVASFFPLVLGGPFGRIIIGAACFTAVMSVLERIQQGSNIGAAVLRVALFGLLTFSSIYSMRWFLEGSLSNGLNQLGSDLLGGALITTTVVSNEVIPPTATIPVKAALPQPTAGATTSVINPTTNVNDLCGKATVFGVDALAIRAQPQLGASLLGEAKRGETVDLVCMPQVSADARAWYHVQSGALDGWMSGRFLNIVEMRKPNNDAIHGEAQISK